MKLFIAFLALAVSAFAADITGNWKGTADAGNGPIERTFKFKVDGTKLTGETESQLIGKSEITDGKVEGDNISFSIKANFQGNEMVLNYKGKISGDTIKISTEFPGGGQTIEWVLKKQ
jgi:hypothetical protein